jgi:hypothetical protein
MRVPCPKGTRHGRPSHKQHEGRYQVVNNKLEALTHAGIAAQMNGKALAELECWDVRPRNDSFGCLE